ncbi:MAG: hydrogenase maturation protease [Leptolyngbyaceae cyanobacterium MO_188.B28]|nr:hydrogenase maturation protease [Leptolyngbyaceae cyanobacterium MO_188.B28]
MTTATATLTATNATLENRHCTFLIVGYGNELHGDDAIGSHVATAVATWGLPQLRSLSVQKLTPELSETLANAEYVVFVDACRMNCPEGVRFKPINACGSEPGGCSIPAAGHSCDPCTLLALTQSVYGRRPQSWWLEVPAENFDLSKGLSSIAELGVARALEKIQFLVRHYSRPTLRALPA